MKHRRRDVLKVICITQDLNTSLHHENKYWNLFISKTVTKLLLILNNYLPNLFSMLILTLYFFITFYSFNLRIVSKFPETAFNTSIGESVVDHKKRSNAGFSFYCSRTTQLATL